MKIAHISDIHGDLDACASLEGFLKDNDDIRVLVCSGDILGQCLSVEQAMEGHEAFKYIIQHVKLDEKMTLEETLELLKRTGGDFQKEAETYEKAVKEFDKNAENQYTAISNILERVPQEVLTIPGNWDSKQYFEYFKESNIHKRSKEVDDVKFSGYGESPEGVIFVPPSRTVGYSDEELYHFFVRELPDVAVTHVPPYKMRTEGSNGSMANLAAMLKTTPDLLLCGHCHDGRGAEKEETSELLVNNSGNLGRYSGSQMSGTFTVIERNDEGFVMPTPYKIGDDGKVYTIGGKLVEEEEK